MGVEVMQGLGYVAAEPQSTTVSGLGVLSCHETHVQSTSDGPVAACETPGAAFTLDGCAPRANCSSSACSDYTSEVAVNGYDFKAGYMEKLCSTDDCTREDDLDTCCVMLPPPGSLTAALTLAMAVEEWSESMEAQLVAELAELLSLDPARLAFQAANGGSVVFSFLFLPPDANANGGELVSIVSSQPERLSSPLLGRVDTSVPITFTAPDGTPVDASSLPGAPGYRAPGGGNNNVGAEQPATLDKPQETGGGSLEIIVMVVFWLAVGVGLLVMRHVRGKADAVAGDSTKIKVSNPLMDIQGSDDEDDAKQSSDAMQSSGDGAD